MSVLAPTVSLSAESKSPPPVNICKLLINGTLKSPITLCFINIVCNSFIHSTLFKTSFCVPCGSLGTPIHKTVDVSNFLAFRIPDDKLCLNYHATSQWKIFSIWNNEISMMKRFARVNSVVPFPAFPLNGKPEYCVMISLYQNLIPMYHLDQIKMRMFSVILKQWNQILTPWDGWHVSGEIKANLIA